MARKTLKSLLRGEVKPRSLAPGGCLPALALVAFMRYAEDNAGALGVTLDEGELDQSDLVEACARLGENRLYTREMVDPDGVWLGIAGQLGFDRGAFSAFLEGIGDGALAEACSLCDLEPGDLERPGPAARRRVASLAREAAADACGLPARLPEAVEAVAGDVACISRLFEGDVLVPAAGSAGIPARVASGLGTGEPPLTCEGDLPPRLTVCAHDPVSYALAGMAALVSLDAGGRGSVRLELSDPVLSPLSRNAPDGRPFASAVCDFASFQAAALSNRDMTWAEMVERARATWVGQVRGETLPEGDIGWFMRADAASVSPSALMVLRLAGTVDGFSGKNVAALVEARHDTDTGDGGTEWLRRLLVENGVIDAVLEFDHVDGVPDLALWVMNVQREPSMKRRGSVLFARLSGDGFDGMCEGTCGEGWDFYEHVDDMEQAGKMAGSIASVYAGHVEVASMSVEVDAADILAMEGCPFNYSAYGETIDVDARILRQSRRWEALKERVECALAESEGCDERFFELVEGLA